MVDEDLDRDEVRFTEVVYEPTHITIASGINTERICFLYICTHTQTYKHHHLLGAHTGPVKLKKMELVFTLIHSLIGTFSIT